jgi:hypothetical protein
LTEEERKRLHDDLVASRERATQLGTAPDAPPSTQSAGTDGKP